MKIFCEMKEYSPIPNFEENKGGEFTQNDTLKDLDKKQLIKMILQVTKEKEEKIKEKIKELMEKLLFIEKNNSCSN